MPNLLERRRMKRRLMALGQQPVYNIYYTDAQAIRQLPNLSQNLVQSYPQLEQTIQPVQRLRDVFSVPTTNHHFFSSNENNRELFTCPRSSDNLIKREKMPFFPEENQRRYESLCKKQSHETSDSLDRQSSFPKNYWDRKSSVERRDNCLISTSESRRSCNRGNSNNPHITLPAQPIGSNHGYSMKIQVLTTPLKSKGSTGKALDDDPKSAGEFDSLTDFAKLRVPAEFYEGQSPICPQLMEAKKGRSILAKLKRTIDKKRSRTIVNDPDDSSSSNSAQEILSPRQLIESTTNVCSSIGNSEIERPSSSRLVATDFQEALKNLEETLKIDAEPTKLRKASNYQFSSSLTPVLCESCKLKDPPDLQDRSTLRQARNLSRSCCDQLQKISHYSHPAWNTLCPQQTLDHSLPDFHYKIRRHAQLFRDHSPPERDGPTQAVDKNSHSQNPIPQNTNRCCRPLDANPTCCGLVMYGQEQPIFNSTKDECCTKTIPVCGTVSQGFSPGYEPNYAPHSGYDRNLPHCHQRYGQRHDAQEQRGLRPDFRRRNNSNLEFPTSPVLKTLAKAANLMLTSIFGRTKSRANNKRPTTRSIGVTRDEGSYKKRPSVTRQKSENSLTRERS